MSNVTTHTVGVAMNGVTGRMGTNQHLMRSILAIRKQGGVKLSETEVIMPEPLLVGRNPAKLKRLCAQTSLTRWTTDLDGALSDPSIQIYFDAQSTDLRVPSALKAIEAGKHIYCEKPTALTTDQAVLLYKKAREVGVKHGVVQDKLWLPGIRKLAMLRRGGFFGRVLAARGEFGYWVFPGDTVPAQRPSWNYRKERGGGIILDMFSHWRYVLDNVIAPVRSVSCIASIDIPARWDENGTPYQATAEDSAYATFELEGGTVAHFNSSWCVRVRRDDLLTIQVDGTKGSAVCGLRKCFIQPDQATPRPVWNPDIESPLNYFDHWIEVPGEPSYENAFKAQWECFLKHVVAGEPFPWDLLAGAKGVQLAEVATQSWKSGRRLPVPELT